MDKETKKYYTGVGSRNTPKGYQELMAQLAQFFYKQGYILRTGNAKGADRAFASAIENNKTIYTTKDSNEKCLAIAERIHPNWSALKDEWKKLHARNVKQVLGDDLNTPSDFLICWTDKGEKKGGTRTAIILAEENNIPVFNLAKKEDIALLQELIDGLKNEKNI